MDHYVDKASEYLKALCDVKPNRRTGSSGNREATDFFEKTIRKYGYDIDAASFATLDYVCHDTSLTYGEHSYAVYVSPYSLGCDITAEIITVSTVEELENADCEGKILLLKGAICEEQLAPKNFVFYNPEHHKHRCLHRIPARCSSAYRARPSALRKASRYRPFRRRA